MRQKSSFQKSTAALYMYQVTDHLFSTALLNLIL